MADKVISFQDELEFFISNQDDLVRQYRGKVLAIKGNKVVGVYRDMIEAYNEAQRENKLGTVHLQRCEPGPDAYTVIITSSVSSAGWPNVAPR